MSRPKALGSHVFAGGFTLGVRNAGFEVDCVLEVADIHVKQARASQPEVPVIIGQENWPLDRLASGPRFDLIYGNPPCAAWSAAGAPSSAKTRLERSREDFVDPRVENTYIHLSLLERLRPRAWVTESVSNIVTRGRKVLDDLTRRILDLGYHATWLIHDAQWLGVPQRRKRFFLIATDYAFDVDESKIIWRQITASEALDGIEDPGVEYLDGLKTYDFLEQVPPGGKLRETFEKLVPEEKRRRNKHGHVIWRPPFAYRRLHPDKPSLVVFNAIVHHREHRFLSTKELGVLCGYPEDYGFPNIQNKSIHNVIGQGVCPPVAEWLGKELLRCQQRDQQLLMPSMQVIDISKPPDQR